MLVAVLDGAAGKRNHALDIIQRWIFGIAKPHYVAALRVVKLNNFPVDDRQAYAIGEFVHQNKVADLQGGDHRTGRNLEWFDQERADEKHDQDYREEALGIFHPPWLGYTLAALAPQYEAVQQPHPAGDHQQHKQN